MCDGQAGCAGERAKGVRTRHSATRPGSGGSIATFAQVGLFIRSHIARPNAHVVPCAVLRPPLPPFSTHPRAPRHRPSSSSRDTSGGLLPSAWRSNACSPVAARSTADTSEPSTSGAAGRPPCAVNFGCAAAAAAGFAPAAAAAAAFGAARCRLGAACAPPAAAATAPHAPLRAAAARSRVRRRRRLRTLLLLREGAAYSAACRLLRRRPRRRHAAVAHAVGGGGHARASEGGVGEEHLGARAAAAPPRPGAARRRGGSAASTAWRPAGAAPTAPTLPSRRRACPRGALHLLLLQVLLLDPRLAHRAALLGRRRVRELGTSFTPSAPPRPSAPPPPPSSPSAG